MGFDILGMVNDTVKEIETEAATEAMLEVEANRKVETYINHPFKDASLEEKLLYLQSLALVMNADKVIDDNEKQYLTILINSFELEGDLLDGIVEFASSPDKESVKAFFGKFANHDILPVLLFDALSMVHRDGALDDAESALVAIFCKQLQIDEAVQQKVTTLFDAIAQQKWQQAARYLFLNVLEASSFEHIFTFHQQNLAELITLENTITIGGASFNMKPIPAGRFMMGNSGDNDNENQTEKPYHEVSIKAFSMMEALVTFELWQERLKETGVPYVPSAEFGEGKHPLINMSWDDINDDFIPWLNKKTGKTFRLPTEAEWEYACRAGTTSEYNVGDSIDKTQASFGYNPKNTYKVKSYAANNWGLYDMHGNVHEWVEDLYVAKYNNAPTDGSSVTEGGTDRVLRGGSFESSNASYLRSASRTYMSTNDRKYYIGFRLVQDV